MIDDAGHSANPFITVDGFIVDIGNIQASIRIGCAAPAVERLIGISLTN